MVLPQPVGSPHTHRPSIVLAVPAPRDSSLAGEGTNFNKREKTKPCKQDWEFWATGENVQSVEGKGGWIQEKEKWMGRRTNQTIDIAFLVSVSNPPTRMSSPASCQTHSS